MSISDWIVPVAVAITALAAVAGLVLALVTVLAMRRQREADLLLRLYMMINEGFLIDARRKTKDLNYTAITSLDNFDGMYELNQVLDFLETVALMVKQGMLRKELIQELMLNTVVNAVDKNAQYITHVRTKDPTYFEHLTDLANELRPFKHPKTATPRPGLWKRITRDV